VGLEHADVDCGPRPGEGDKVGSEASELFAGPSTRFRRIATACSAGDPRGVKAPSWHRGDVFALVGRRGATGSSLRRRQLASDGRVVSEFDVPLGTQAAATDETGEYLVVFRSARDTGKDSDSFDVEKQAGPPSPG